MDENVGSFTLKKLLEFVEEDFGRGDVTCDALGIRDERVKAIVKANENGFLAGVNEVSLLMEHFKLRCNALKQDGASFDKGDHLLEIEGPARLILGLERTILNLLSHMSGVATLTKRVVDKARRVNPNVIIAATRKTLPGLRYFEKKAVVIGGGDPHRMDLSDMVLIKSNHLRLVGLEEALKRAKSNVSFSKKIEVEVSTVDEALIAAKFGADAVMLDNMDPVNVKEAVNALEKEGLRDRVLLEVSGNITLDNVVDYAATGIDVISLGVLTHSAKAVDMCLDVE